MNETEKLFRKINKKDRLVLREELSLLLSGKHKSINVKKLKGSDFSRLRKGKFRIIFHYEAAGKLIIDAVRIKGEDTYKDFI